MRTADPETRADADLARECVYRFLAMALSSPYEPGWPSILNRDDQRLAREAAALLRDEADFPADFLSFGELPPDSLDLDSLLDALNQPVEQLQAEYDRVFGLVIPKECPPYETEYHPSSQAFQRAQQMADIAGFYRAFGLEPSGANLGRPDHVTLEFEFMAFILMKKRLASTTEDGGDAPSEHHLVCEQAEQSFVKDHLAWWVPAFATGLLRKSGGGYYHALARTLAALIPAERHRLNLPAPFQSARPELIEYPEEESGCASCASQT